MYSGAVILKVGSIHPPFTLAVFPAESIGGTLLKHFGRRHVRQSPRPSKSTEPAADDIEPTERREIYSPASVQWPIYNDRIRQQQRVLDSVRAEIMRLHEKLEPRPHETRVQELSRERKSEKRQLERLAALLAKKADLATANLPDDIAA